MDYIKEPYSGLDLVRLQVADHVPGDALGQVRKLSQFRLRFLYAVLAEVFNPDGGRLPDGVWRESLCDSDERYFVRRPDAALARGLDSAPHIFNALGDRLSAHRRKYSRCSSYT